MGLVGTYLNSLSNWLSNGAFVNKVGMSSLGIRPLYDRIITKSSVKKILLLVSFPDNLETNLTSVINRKISKVLPDCSVIFTSENFRSNLHNTYKTGDFRKNMSQAEDRYRKYKMGMDSLSETERTAGKNIRIPGGGTLHVSKEELDFLKSNFESYRYVYDTVSNGGHILDSYLYIEMIAPDNKQMRALEEIVDLLLVGMGCSYIPIKNANSKYLSKMSPTGYFYRDDTDKQFSNTLLSSENLAYLMPYMSNGFIGDGSGTLMGLDIGSRAPFILNFQKTGDRQIIAFIVPSGKGKTMTCFMICMYMIGQGMHCSTFDIKGDEWIKLRPYVKDLNVIDISSANGCYVNTMRLDDIVDLIEGNETDAKQFLNSAKESTVEILRIMSNYDETNPEYADAMNVIERAVSKYFIINGVRVHNYKTFEKTSTFNYRDLIKFIPQLKQDTTFAHIEHIVDSIVRRTTAFMDTHPMFDGKEVTIRDVLDSPLNIYSFNNNSGEVSNEIVDRVKTFMFTYLDSKKIYIRKTRGLATTCFYEELQRKEEFSRMIRYINGVVTGARSSNVTVFLLCNSPSTFLDKDISPVTSNISTYIVGNISEQDEEVLEKIGLRDLIPKVSDMRENQDKYNYCFACKFDTGDQRNTCIFTAMIPPSVMDTLKTRDIEEN